MNALRRVAPVSLVALVILLVVALSGAGGTRAQDSKLVWAQIKDVLPAGLSMTSVYMSDENAAWVGGDVQTHKRLARARNTGHKTDELPFLNTSLVNERFNVA